LKDRLRDIFEGKVRRNYFRNYSFTWQSSTWADETTNFAIYLYLFIFGIHVYAATIHNTTEETSREGYVSTIEYERIMSESHSFVCI